MLKVHVLWGGEAKYGVMGRALGKPQEQPGRATALPLHPRLAWHPASGTVRGWSWACGLPHSWTFTGCPQMKFF